MTLEGSASTFMDLAREGGLIADAQAGNREAYMELVRHYQRPLFRVLRALAHSTDEATRLTQDAFARAWHGMPEFPTGRRFFPWLLRVAQQLPWASEAPPPGDGRGDPVLAAFAGLRRDEQLALALRAAGGFRYEEIAVLLDVPIGIAFLRISQARGSMLRWADREARIGT